MSDYAYVAERARKIFASVSRLESDLAKTPNNWAVRRNLRSMQKLASQAREEMERLASINQIDVCDYRIIPTDGWNYALEHVAKSFLQYQWLFSQVYDAVRNGPKNRSIIGKEAAERSSLDFGFSYSGSLGVVLLCQSDRDFFEGNLDKPIEALFDALDVQSTDDIKDLSRSLGRAVVKRVYDWSKANLDGGFSADVQWKRSDGKIMAQMVGKERMSKIVDVIDATADETTETHAVRGMLVAVSLPARSFHITVPEGESYSGHFHADFAQPPQMTVGRIYDARIEVLDTYQYATEQHRVRNTLVSLKGPITLDSVD